MIDWESGHKFDVMTSTALIGKAPKGFNWAAYYATFSPVLLTPRELAVHIWRGYSFTPVWKESRREGNFVSAGHIAFDFDAGNQTSGLDYLMRDGTFAWMFASFGYSTPSSTPAAPRSRLVFILEYPIYSAQEYRDVYQAVAWYMALDGSHTDPACKDPLRLYYGSKDCAVKTNWSVLGKGAIDTALAEYRKENPIAEIKPAAFVAPVDPTPGMQNGKLRQLGEKVRIAPINEGHATLLKMARLAGGYVASNSLNEADAINELTRAAMTRPDPDEKEIDRVIRDGIEYGKATPLRFEQKRPLTEMF